MIVDLSDTVTITLFDWHCMRLALLFCVVAVGRYTWREWQALKEWDRQHKRVTIKGEL